MPTEGAPEATRPNGLTSFIHAFMHSFKERISQQFRQPESPEGVLFRPADCGPTWRRLHPCLPGALRIRLPIATV
eukprot:1194698-Prorocentrum_minimum.AAC.3